MLRILIHVSGNGPHLQAGLRLSLHRLGHWRALKPSPAVRGGGGRGEGGGGQSFFNLCPTASSDYLYRPHIKSPMIDGCPENEVEDNQSRIIKSSLGIPPTGNCCHATTISISTN